MNTNDVKELDDLNQDNNDVQVETPEENNRRALVERAEILGLKFPKNITTPKLAELVAEALSNPESEQKELNVAAQQYQDMLALVRVRITVLNPAKQSWDGEIFSVGNDRIPVQKRYIPFNAVDGVWHIERIFVEMLKSRKYQFMTEHATGSNPKAYGVDTSKIKLLPEFSIEELPPLTKEELEELGKQQAMQGSIQNS